MKNILIIGPIPPNFGGKYFGGVATHIEGLADALSKRKYNVSIWNYKYQKNKFYTNKNIQVIGNSLLSYLNLVTCFVKALFCSEDYLSLTENTLLFYKKTRLDAILKSRRFDVIHIHSIHETSAIVIRKLLDYNDIRIVSTDHGFWQSTTFNSNKMNALNKLSHIVNCINKIVYISNYAYKKHLENEFNQLKKLVKISNPLSVNVNNIKVYKYLDKKVIFFNGLSESIKRKRFDLLLQAIQNDDFLKLNVKLIAIVNQKGIEYVNSNNFDFEIELHGPIPMNKVDELYAKSDLMVLPSISESFGLVYIESLMRGVPIVGFDEVIKEFQEQMGCYIGECYNSINNDYVDLANKITKALSYNFDTETIKSKSIEIFSWNAKISEFENLYFNEQQ